MGYKVKWERISGNHVLGHRARAANADNLVLAGLVTMEDLRWYVPHCTPNIPTQKIMLGHIVSKTAKEVSYIERSSYKKEKITENIWTFDLGVGDGVDIPIYVIVFFMLWDQLNQQHQ